MTDQSKLLSYQNKVLDGIERVLNQVINQASADLAEDKIGQGVFDVLDGECHTIKKEIWKARDRIKIITQ